MKQSVYLGEFALAALAGEGTKGSGPDLATALIGAIRVYLNDADAGQPGWPFPNFLPARAEAAEVKLELDIDEDLWRALENEAGRQGVSPSQLASHASLYYAAELNSGRLTRRIADDLESGGG